METAVAHADLPGFREALILLGASVAVILVLHRLRASPVLGYLVTGLVIGPHALGLFPDDGSIRVLAELGVVFLLFTIGLELSLERLRAMRRLVFGLGAAQVGLTGAVLGLIAWLAGLGGPAALIVGLALAFSSTAIVIQLLVERGEIATRMGRSAFAILLFQDLAVVPLLVMVQLLGGTEGSAMAAVGEALGKAALAVVLILVAGRFVVRPLYRRVAQVHSAELMTAMTLIVILATAWGTHAAGLSMALGGFLAGQLLAETEFRHQIDADIQPFRGLLLGLFFMTVGMAIDLGAVAADLVWIVPAALVLILVKAAIVTGLARLFGHPWESALPLGLVLGQGGEFAFVVLGAAVVLGLVTGTAGQILLVMCGLTMMVTPALAAVGGRIGRAVERRHTIASHAPDATTDELENHVVIAGFGRVGQTVAALLHEQGVPYVALDLEPGRVRAVKQRGLPVFFGDAARHEVLTRVGVDRAAALVVTLDDPAAARRTLAAVHSRWPRLPMFVRAHDAGQVRALEDLGAGGVVPETLETSLMLASMTLRRLGFPAEAIAAQTDRVRKESHGVGFEPIAAAPAAAPSAAVAFESEPVNPG